MAIGDYDELKSSIADWLNRSDLTSVIPDFVTMAEASLQRDPRVRTLVDTTLTVDSETETLPAQFRGIEGLYHDGTTYYGELDNVAPGELSRIKDAHGDDDVPIAYSIVNDTTLRFAPVPDATYTLGFAYWATISHLSDTNLSNWLLDDHPDIYLYASLLESAPYLRDDPRIPVWEQKLEKRLEELHRHVSSSQYSGRLVRSPDRWIP